MPYDPQKHHRHSIRLKDYDYTRAGLYFVTICAQNRECLFGNAEADQIQLNDAGRMVGQKWDELPLRFKTVILDASVIMPNHFHAIVTKFRTVTQHLFQ